MIETADVVVIGLGAVGSATLYRLALGGAKVIGIDRFHPPHDRGSSHGESRISRLAVGEGAAYAPLVRRSHEIWRELKQQTGETLFQETGGLIMGPQHGAANHHGKGDFVRRSVAIAEEGAFSHELLDADEIARRFPQLLLTGDEIAYYEPSAGTIFPERCIAVQIGLAQALGATTHMGETVATIRPIAGGGVEIVTDRRKMHAARVVLSAGPWAPGLAGGGLRDLAKVYRQTLHWFTVDDPAAFAPGRFPIFIWMHGESEEDYLYGFPAMPGATAIKVASERYASPVSPDSFERVVSPQESAEIYRRHVSGRLAGVRPKCVKSAACLYTVTPDAGFILDHLSDNPDVLVASACSGHGFKHSAAVGELLAARAAGTVEDANPFGLNRFPATPIA